MRSAAPISPVANERPHRRRIDSKAQTDASIVVSFIVSQHVLVTDLVTGALRRRTRLLDLHRPRCRRTVWTPQAQRSHWASRRRPRRHRFGGVVSPADHDPGVGKFGRCPCGVVATSEVCRRDGPYSTAHFRPSPSGTVVRVLAKRISWRPHWVDHWYRYRDEAGDMVYVTEPYQLDEDGLEDIAWLRDHGFDVMITAWRARHCPGHIVAVEIRAVGRVSQRGS